MIGIYNDVFSTGFGYTEALYLIFAIASVLWIIIALRKLQKEKLRKVLDYKKATKLEMIHEWIEVSLRTALKVYTNYSTNLKHIKAKYLVSEDALNDIDFIANIRGARYISSSTNLVKVENDINMTKTLFYLIDDLGVSYILLLTGSFLLTNTNGEEETYDINYILDAIYVVEKNKLSLLSKANPDNVLLINKNIDNVLYTDYKDVIVSKLRMNKEISNNDDKILSGEYMYFNITDMDNPSIFKTYEYRIKVISDKFII